MRTPSARLVAAFAFVAAVAATPLAFGPATLPHSLREMVAFDLAMKEPTPENKAAWQRERTRILREAAFVSVGVHAVGGAIVAGIVLVVLGRRDRWLSH